VKGDRHERQSLDPQSTRSFIPRTIAWLRPVTSTAEQCITADISHATPAISKNRWALGSVPGTGRIGGDALPVRWQCADSEEIRVRYCWDLKYQHSTDSDIYY